LNAPSGKSVLVITSIGFAELEVPINDRAEITIGITNLATSLQDVVVVGYGTQKKSDVTGAVSRLTAEDIRERPTQNALQAIQGKAPGVHVSSNIKPGELPIVRVRGNRSLSASNDPLYVIDGIPLVNALGVNSFTMADLNPNDIASIEILKDASATAIYGSRGANGVILVTTNKGKKGRTSVNFSSTISLDNYKAMTDWMDGGEYADRWRESLINGRTYHNIANNADLNVAPKSWYPNPGDDSIMIRLPGALDPIAMASVMMGYEWNPMVPLKCVLLRRQKKIWDGLLWFQHIIQQIFAASTGSMQPPTRVLHRTIKFQLLPVLNYRVWPYHLAIINNWVYKETRIINALL
jgi:TonB-dependent SusC/RagA subfamily outer membrane receptor